MDSIQHQTITTSETRVFTADSGCSCGNQTNFSQLQIESSISKEAIATQIGNELGGSLIVNLSASHIKF